MSQASAYLLNPKYSFELTYCLYISILPCCLYCNLSKISFFCFHGTVLLPRFRGPNPVPFRKRVQRYNLFWNWQNFWHLFLQFYVFFLTIATFTALSHYIYLHARGKYAFWEWKGHWPLAISLWLFWSQRVYKTTSQRVYESTSQRVTIWTGSQWLMANGQWHFSLEGESVYKSTSLEDFEISRNSRICVCVIVCVPHPDG